jgi:hypothetical protein
VKTKTEQERTVNSAREELELGTEEVKALIDPWRQRLRDKPMDLSVIEKEVHQHMARLADYLLGGLLVEVTADGPTPFLPHVFRKTRVSATFPPKANS